MNIKLVGVGKCGSRICYDFFAQIRGLPTSYEIKTKGQDSAFAEIWRRIRAKTGIERSTMEIRRQWESLTGAELLKDSAYYAMVDSDLDNNEVARQVELLSKSGETAIFPGYSHKLADQNGGCQFHIISENLTRNWQTSQVPQDVLSPVSAEVFAFAFSVGGGTGGGLRNSTCWEE